MSAKASTPNRWVITQPTSFDHRSQTRWTKFATRSFSVVVAALFAILTTFLLSFHDSSLIANTLKFERNLYTPVFDHTKQALLTRCARITATPGPSASFLARDKSDRYEKGTNATLIRNAVIFTGKDDGQQIIHGDLLLDKGIVRGIGKISPRVIDSIKNLKEIDVNGAWVTPGLVDLHTHMGVLSTPILSGAVDFDSAKGPILPWLRSVDGLNTHDESYELALAGGVTSVQVLPGGSNAIGGQSFMVKLRKTKDRTASSMIIEPPETLVIPRGDDDDDAAFATHHWRHMKQACGESTRVHGNRMDTMWSLRVAYTEAIKMKAAQDEFCAKAENGLWDLINTPFPEDLKWEALVDVLRGKVKVSTHCSEAVDLDAMARLSNEFKFPIASLHSASEAWLVPSLVRKFYGSVPPSVALSATNHRGKKETYRGSEFASRVLSDHDVPIILKSDHPVVNSRYLLYEAQQAHYYGLPPNVALAAVTSSPAAAAGLLHRIGVLEEGSDADVVLWDSHPLRVGATPQKVWVDGILQIPVPSKTGEETHVVIGRGKEADEWKRKPYVPDWEQERNQSIRWDGLPPLRGRETEDRIAFINVKQVWKRVLDGEVHEAFTAESTEEGLQLGMVVVEAGKLSCLGVDCGDLVGNAEVIDLRGGVVSSGLMTYGSPLGIEEIASEPSTGDGTTFNAFETDVPRVLDDTGAVVRAVDGLIFGTRNALIAYKSGVTFATSSLAKPVQVGGPEAQIICGLSVTFRTGSGHAMERGALIQEVVALHVAIGKSHPLLKGVSVSTQIAGLRRLLYGWESSEKETGHWFKQAAEGIVPLVIDVDSADIMANLILLKIDVEDKIGAQMRMVFSGAAEAHLLAQEISNARIGVILNPIRAVPTVWDQRRILPGPPLSNDTTLVKLLDKGVIVGMGIRHAWQAQTTRFDVQWASFESNKRVSEQQAYALVTHDLENLLGIRNMGEDSDLVVWEGGSMFDMSSKAIGVISPIKGTVELF
ncbi:carbohydrate esterase family 9 protein [Crepidotus variabilis]|uniref:Carbohydrate esterase family 9 protein n=1 Tax=Crepidotus variabilis TaxID=179855 RepID=A0A9P6ETT6_9AGAR|nr:carbohydrate esterase family 9 protein [Crepidotus variabilis]